MYTQGSILKFAIDYVNLIFLNEIILFLLHKSISRNIRLVKCYKSRMAKKIKSLDFIF